MIKINLETFSINQVTKNNLDTKITSREANMETKKTIEIKKALEIKVITMDKDHTLTKINISNHLTQLRKNPSITTDNLIKDSIIKINLIRTTITNIINHTKNMIDTGTKTIDSDLTKEIIQTIKINHGTTTTIITKIIISEPTIILINFPNNSIKTDLITISTKITRNINSKTSPNKKMIATTSTDTIRPTTITIFLLIIITLLHSSKTCLLLNLYLLIKTIQFLFLKKTPIIIKTH
jgi:hypothetical protein